MVGYLFISEIEANEDGFIVGGCSHSAKRYFIEVKPISSQSEFYSDAYKSFRDKVYKSGILKKGILFIVKNYSGDIMNFEMGADMIDFDHETILINDDVAVEDSTFTTGRRGVAGTMIVEKTVGSLAETGASLKECKLFGDQVNNVTASMGVAFTSCTVPAAGKPTFELGDEEMEFGVGIHGEPGRKREKIKTANELTNDIISSILEDLKPDKNEKVLMHVNGFGGTPLMELYLLFDVGQKILEEKGINVSRSLVGNYTTSLDMAGASFSITKLDEKIIKHWDSAVHTAALRWKI